MGNNSSISAILEIPGTGPSGPMGEPPAPELIPLGGTWLDVANGTYNLSFTVPTFVGAGVYSLNIEADFNSAALPGGAYFYTEEGISIDIGVESEAVLVAIDPP